MKFFKTSKIKLIFVSLVVFMALISVGCGSTEKGEEKQAAKSGRDYILIGRPNPTTGPISGLGAGAEWSIQKGIDAINKDGGFYVKELDKKLPVKIKVVDTESNPTKATEVASKLVLEDKVDMLWVEHTPDTVNPVSAVAERYGIPTISIEAPTGSWLSGGPYKWTYHAFWTHDQVSDMIIGQWDTMAAKTNKKVGFVNANDTDGKVWKETFTAKLPARGYTVVDPGQFPIFTKDYSAIINQFKKENVEILTGAMIPPDFATFWKQAKQLGWQPKMVSVAKPYLLPSDVNALGADLANGLLSEVWWSPEYPWKSSLTGETSKAIADAWEKETGKPWQQTLGFEHAGFELIADVLKRAQTLDKEKLRDAIAQTNLETVVGPIKFNDQHYSETPVVGGQWVKNADGKLELKIIYNEQAKMIPKTAEMLFPLPK